MEFLLGYSQFLKEKNEKFYMTGDLNASSVHQFVATMHPGIKETSVINVIQKFIDESEQIHDKIRERLSDEDSLSMLTFTIMKHLQDKYGYSLKYLD